MIERDPLHNELRFALNQRQLSLLIAGLLAFTFFIFISGYFLGKKKAAEEFSYKADQESLADQIYSSMCVLYDAKDESEDVEENEQENENSQNSEVLEKKEEIIPEVENSTTTQESTGPKYFAALAGFSSTTLADGKKMLNRLKGRGFEVQMVERTSKTAKGQSHAWHQIITAPFTNREELKEIVGQIAKLEHIKEKNISIQEMRQVSV
jgi:cell division septation protein DedD